MANKYWLKQDEIFLKATESVKVPNGKLCKVPNIIVKKKSDINQIPEKGGCYWIWSNEPIYHSFHKYNFPKPFYKGEIIYNGIAKDNIKDRILHHLFGDIDTRWSAISMDIYSKESISHRKKALAQKGKVPYILINKSVKRGNKSRGLKKGDIVKVYCPVRSKEELLKLFLSNKEKKYINKTVYDEYFFRNGVNIMENKHKGYKFRIYFITGLSISYLGYIEKKWRENGLPRLCSYSTGR